MSNHFDVQITRSERAAADLDSITKTAERALWRDALQTLATRTYSADARTVTVTIDWRPLVAAGEATAHLPLEVSGSIDPVQVPSFVELFFHDVFLLLNLAVPGSFGAFIHASGGAYRVNELAFDARLFEYAWIAARRGGNEPPIEPLPLADVVRWYDALALGTQQVATTPIAKALFLLLRIARSGGEEVHLARALDALSLPSAALTADVVLHPMEDDSLDPRVDDFDASDTVDRAAALLVSTIQRDVRR